MVPVGAWAFSLLSSLVKSHLAFFPAVAPRQAELVLLHIQGIILGGLLVATIYLPLRREAEQRQQADDMLHKLGRKLAAHGRPFIIMGDWNMAPEEVERLGLPHRLGASIVASTAFTCFSGTQVGTVPAHLDYFMVAEPLLPLVKDIRVVPIKPNPCMPVVLRLWSYHHLPPVRVPIKPLALPLDRPYGPDVEQDWASRQPLLDGLPQAEQVIESDVHGGTEFVRGLIQRWSFLTERCLTEVRQIPEKVRAVTSQIRRYSHENR